MQFSSTKYIVLKRGYDQEMLLINNIEMFLIMNVECQIDLVLKLSVDY